MGQIQHAEPEPDLVGTLALALAPALALHARLELMPASTWPQPCAQGQVIWSLVLGNLAVRDWWHNVNCHSSPCQMYDL